MSQNIFTSNTAPQVAGAISGASVVKPSALIGSFDATGFVSDALSDASGTLPALETATAPTLTGDFLRFNGTTQYLETAEQTDKTLHLFKTTNLPDASGGVAGEGFTITGIFRAPNGTYWAANDGRGAPGDTTHEPSLVNLSADFTTVLSEIDLKLIDSNIDGVQGVIMDKAGTLWVASRNTDEIVHVSTAGVELPGTISLAYSPNALGYDELNDAVWCAEGNAGAAGLIRLSDGVVLDTLSYGTNEDHFFYDNATRYLWITSGSNGTDGDIRVLDTVTGKIIGDYVDLEDAQAIEGIYVNGQYIVIANDGYFHGDEAVPAKNVILQYEGQLFKPNTMYRDELVISIVLQRQSTPATLKSILTADDPIADIGIGIYAIGTELRVATSSTWDASDRVIKTYPAALGTDKALLTVTMDQANNELKTYIDGVQIGTTSAINFTDAYRLTEFVVGASREGGTLARFSEIDLYGIRISQSLADKSIIEEELAKKYSISI